MMPVVAVTAARSIPGTALATPTTMVVPKAPKATAALSAMRVSITASRGLTPSTTSRGAAMAAGVPNPATPSRKETKNQPMMMT